MWRNLCASLLYFEVRVRCRRKKSSRSIAISSPDELLVTLTVTVNIVVFRLM